MHDRQFKKTHHTVTDIVATVYCEQKLVFDRTHGKATPYSVRTKAAAGEFEHLRFQTEGYTRMARNPLRLIVHLAGNGKLRKRAAHDSRCFIATQVYGAHADETNFFRAWRDRVLTPSIAGRFIVRSYYALSPFLVSVLSKSDRLSAMARIVLDHVLHVLGRRP